MKKIVPALVLLLMLLSQTTYCQLFGWNYYTPVTIVETSGSPQFNVEVTVSVKTDSFVTLHQMSSTGSDIRFGNDQYGDKLYPYWIQSGMNSASTSFVIKLDTLLGYQCKTIYMFFGNSGAVAVSSLDSVFGGPLSATNYTTGNGTSSTGAAPSGLGIEFSTTQGIVITQLGLSVGAATGYYCTLFDYNSHAIIAQQQITASGSGNNHYIALASPVYLSPGTYMLVDYTPYGTFNYAYSTGLNTGLTYLGTWGVNNAQISTFPYTRLANELEGIPDMIYYIPQNPTTSVSSFMGTSGLALNPASPVNDCLGHTITIGDSATGAVGSVAYIWTPATGLSNAHVPKPQVSLTTGQTYTVTARDASNGCTASAVIVVDVVDPVSATVTDSVCFGQSYFVGTHAHAIAGTYVDTIQSMAGCDSIVTLHLSIHHMVQPVITQSGDSLYTGNYTGYQWLLNSATLTGATGPALRANITGNYQVIGTDAMGCSDTSAAFAFSTVGINQLTGVAAISAYPNPGHGNFVISAPIDYAGQTYKVIDNLGRKVTEGRFNNTTTVLNMTEAPAGIYTLYFAGGSIRLMVVK